MSWAEGGHRYSTSNTIEFDEIDAQIKARPGYVTSYDETSSNGFKVRVYQLVGGGQIRVNWPPASKFSKKLSPSTKLTTPALKLTAAPKRGTGGSYGSVKIPRQLTRERKKKLALRIKKKAKKHKSACQKCKKQLAALRKRKCVRATKSKKGRKKKKK